MQIELTEIKDKVVNKIVVMSAVFLCPAYISSLLRWLEIGWKNIYVLHTGVYFLTLLLSIYRKRFNFEQKTILISLIYLSISLAGLIQFALSGGVYFAIISMAILSILTRRKTAIIINVAIMFLFVLVAIGFSTYIISPIVDLNQLVRSSLHWSAALFSIFSITMIFIFGFGDFYKNLENAIKEKGVAVNKLQFQNELLEASEKKYQMIFEGANDAIFILKNNLVYDCNQKSAFCFQLQKEELLGKNIEELSPLLQYDGQESSEKAKCLIQLVLNNQPQNIEWQLIKSNGELFDVSVTLNKIILQGEVYIQGNFIDITAKKRNEQVLKSSKMKYENLFENSADGILVLNDKSEIIELNHKICEILGYNKEELILLKGYEFIHPEDLANKDHAAALELLLQGKTLLSQYRLQKKEGEYIPTELSTKKIGDGQFLNIVRDVSERVLAEKKIQESEIKYRSFFENSMDAILLTGSDGQIYSANPAACAMFECSEHEMMELGMAGLMDSDDFRLSVLLSTSVQKGKISREITMVRKDRTPFDAEISSAVFENTEAKQFSSVIIRDITARKQAEKLLRESEEKFKLIFHTRPDYVTIVEIEGGTYIDVNDSFIQKSGHAREEIVGHTASDLDIWVNPEDRNRLFEGLFQSGKIENLEAQFRQKDGQIIEGLMSAATMVLNKKPHLIAITRDITELKEVQKVALETQSKLLSAINNTTDAVAISDAYGNLIDFNEAFALFHKFKKKAECPKTNSEYPAILDCFSSTGKLISAEMWAIPRALRGETVSNSVIDLRRKDTGETWVGSFSFSPIRDKDNAIVGSVVVARDITEQKRTEQAYKETAANLRSMIDNREDSIWAIDRDFKHIIFNTTYERIVNNLYKIRLKKGMSFTEKLTEKQFNFWVPKFESVFQGNTVSFEFSDVLYGTVSYFRISLNPIIEDNLIIGASGLSIDITDIKLAEEALKLSEEKFEKTFRLSPYMVVLSTIEGQVIDVNNRVFATLGYPREEFIGNTTVGLDLWPNAAVRESFVSLLEVDEDIHEMEVQFRKKSGEISDFSISACTIELYQQKLILSIIHDISTRKTAENLIKEHNAELESKVNERTAQLEAINKELKTFSYSVSHDLKAPLRGIDGYSKLLSDFYQKDLNPEAQSFIQKIRSSTLQMNQIIDDLLDYSRLERAELNFGLANISDLIESVLSIYRAELEAGIFVFNSKNTTIEIVTDSKGFIIAFRNLIDNAIKFTKGRENPLIEISIEEQQNSWIISVSDNGIGFDMKYHHKVFEIFQRLQRVEDYPGTGIGLALVSKSMQRMGGKAWAESLPNIGSTFYLEMPKNHDYVI